MSQVTFRQKFAYRFDNFMASGGKSMFIILLLLFVSGYICIGLIRAGIETAGADSERGQGFLRQIYITFLQMTDPGNMAQDIESSPWLKISTVLAGLAGIILLSMLIGFITTALVQKMEALRKGHSKVIEDGHTLILGWNEQRVVEILRELVMANESEDNPSVVILADYPKEEMDDHLTLLIPDTDNTRIVTRSGSTSSLTNLCIVSIEHCKSVIVLASASEEAGNEEKNLSDAKSIKTILAVASCRGEEELNIVAELYNQDHHEIVQNSCPHPITVVNANEILAKIIVQTSRSVGLSVAYGEILSFDGCEMYFHHDTWGEINFGELLYRFPDGVVMGIRKADGEIDINPEPSTLMGKEDDILILAEDDSTIEFRPRPVASPSDLPLKPGKLQQNVENELIIGWNRKARIILEEYAEYVLEGSKIDVIIHRPSERIKREIEELDARLHPLTVNLIDANPLEMEVLKNAMPSSRDNIIILSGGDDDAECADSRTILILLLLRRVFTQNPNNGIHTRIVTEVMDSANQRLISDVGVKDFIISNQLISMMLAQVSEEPDIKRVYDNLFDEDGSEIYLKPMTVYLEELPAEMTFADCMGIAQKREEICIGLKIKALENDSSKNFGIQLIPEKNTPFTLQPDDCLVVVSEDET